jgi:hypothetical protein
MKVDQEERQATQEEVKAAMRDGQEIIAAK